MSAEVDCLHYSAIEIDNQTCIPPSRLRDKYLQHQKLEKSL